MNIRNLLLGMLFGMAIGFCGIRYIITNGMHFDGEIILLSFVFLLVSLSIHIVIHEAGHLIAGLATGYTFLSYRILSWMLVIEEEKLKWKKFNISGTLGQCLMIPPVNSEKTPFFWYNAGGVTANLVFAFIPIIMLNCSDYRSTINTALFMMAIVGILVALANGIPMSSDGVNNDGYNILMFCKHAESRKSFATSLFIISELYKGTRLHEMPAEWFVDRPISNPKKQYEINDRAMRMSLLEDLGKLDEARIVAEEIASYGTKIPLLQRMEFGGERVMLELLTTNRRDLVEELWTKQQARYTKQGAKYSPIKLAVLYTYEMLYNNDEQTANKYKCILEQNKLHFPDQGDVKTAMDLCSKCGEKMLYSPQICGE